MTRKAIRMAYVSTRRRRAAPRLRPREAWPRFRQGSRLVADGDRHGQASSSLAQTDERHRGDERDDGHHQRQGRGIADVVLGERFLVGVGGDHLGGVGGAAAGHDEDDVEDVEAADEQERGDDVDHVRHLRHGDIPEALPGVRAVDGRRLEQVLADVLQTGQEDDEDEADRGPDRGDEHGVERDVGIAEPAAGDILQPDGVEDLIEDAEDRVVDPVPDDADDDRREHLRHEEDGAEEGEPVRSAPEQDRPATCR